MRLGITYLLFFAVLNVTFSKNCVQYYNHYRFCVSIFSNLLIFEQNITKLNRQQQNKTKMIILNITFVAKQ